MSDQAEDAGGYTRQIAEKQMRRELVDLIQRMGYEAVEKCLAELLCPTGNMGRKYGQ